MKMKKRFSVREAVSVALGFDFAESEDYRYQSTRTPCPVYTQDMRYLTATRDPSVKPKADEDYTWVKADSCLNDMYGWQLWEKDEL